MKKSKAWFLSLLFVILAVLGISFMSVKKSFREGVEGRKVFIIGGKAELRNTIELSTSKLEQLTIEYGSKNVKLYPTTEEKVIIREYLYSDDPDAAAEVAYPAEGEAVVKGGSVHSMIFFGSWKNPERIEVYVPENALRKFSLETKSGNVKLEKIGGTVEITTGSGNITGEDLEGAFKVTAGSGNITLEDFQGSGDIKAGSGNIRVEALAVTGDFSVTTGSGNIRLELPGDTAFDFRAETGSGNINTDFDEMLSYNRKGNNAEGRVGSDSAASAFQINVKAGSGNVRVSNR